MKRRGLPYTVLLLVVVLTVAAAAQQQRSSSRSQQQQGQQRMQQGQQRSQEGQQRSSDARIVADPQGWVMIGYDTDQDQQVDHYEYIHIYDLRRARQSSRQRSGGQGRTQLRQSRGSRQQDFQATRGRRQRTAQVTGTVQGTTQVRFANQQQEQTFAKVRTQNGKTAVVHLGPSNRVNQMDLSQGDRIRAQGQVCVVNQRPVLMSNRIQANGQTMRVQQPRASKTRRLKGTISKTATKSLRGQNRPNHLIALIELETGETVPVDLGPKQDLQDVSISEGQQVTLLAQPTRIGGKRILTAQSLAVNGQKVDIQWLQNLRRQRSNRQQGTRQQQGGRQQQRSWQQENPRQPQQSW